MAAAPLESPRLIVALRAEAPVLAHDRDFEGLAATTGLKLAEV